MKDQACSLERFRKDTAEHQMEIVLDAGVHRHLRFRKPGTSSYSFDIVTWPGYLAISGDMGASMFWRLTDMFEFFREDQRWQDQHPGELRINAGYWSEKLVANDGEKQKFDSGLFEAVVRDHFDRYMDDQDSEADGFATARDALWEHIRTEVVEGGEDTTASAIERWQDFKPGEDNTSLYAMSADTAGYEGWFEDFHVSDPWEWASSVESYTFQLIWRMYAIAHAVQAYDAHQAAVAASPAATED